MSSIQIGYEAQHLDIGDVTPKIHLVEFSDFSGQDLPRQYLGSSATSQSANGTTILPGPSFKTKRIWAVSAYLPTGGANDELRKMYDLFEDWDQDRGNGLAVAVGVTDTTLFDAVSANAIFSTVPSYTRVSPALYLVDFALTEV